MKRKVESIFSWKFEKRTERDKRVVFGFFGFVFLITLYGLFADNLMLSILMILFGLSMFLVEKRGDREVIFAITKEGIFVHDHIYPYESLQSFWIEYESGGLKEISFKQDSFLLPFIRIPIDEIDPTKLRKALLEFLPEEKHPQDLSGFLDRF